MKSVIAENVKCIISERCLKQCLVAKKAGYTAQAFNNMLNGRKIITDIDVKNIAEALDVDENTLFKKTEVKRNR